MGERDIFGLDNSVEVLQQDNCRSILLSQIHGIAEHAIVHLRCPQHGNEFRGDVRGQRLSAARRPDKQKSSRCGMPSDAYRSWPAKKLSTLIRMSHVM